VLSSGVELHTHQVAAARRVLQDPIRRYLLADEVGLGKTIEAGMIARQLLIEEPGDVLITAPDSLTAQWEREMARKFRLDSVGGRVQVVSFDELADVADGQRRLVIVDEAHRLVNWSADGDAAQRAYGRLRDLGSSTDALLLLSATPVRSNEDVFLRLLHLLDPDSYRLEDLEGFRHRVAMRDDLAAAMSGLSLELPVDFLVDEVARAAGLVQGDPEVARIAEEFMALVSAGEEEAARLTVRRLRGHLGETYRVHRRMIRTRRTRSLAESFPVRGRRKATEWTIVDPDQRRQHLPVLIDAVRLCLQSHESDLARRVLRLVLGRLTGPVESLEELVRLLEAGVAGVDEEDVIGEIAGTDLARDLVDAISVVTRHRAEVSRSAAVATWVGRHVGRQRVAVACGSTAIADELAAVLVAELGSHRVARLTGTMTAEERHAESERFVDAESRLCTVLVLDRSAEEGLNLQSASKVLHYDLVLSANRIEQRLGRFDRWSDNLLQPVESVVFVESDDDRELELSAWRRLLDEAFDIFDRSTATLQHVLPEFEERFLDAVLEDGPVQATADLLSISEEIERQRRRITHQDQLDAIEEMVEDGELVDAIGALDSDPEAIQAAVRQYAVDALQLDIEGVGSPTVGYGMKRALPLVPDSIASRMVESVLAGTRRRIEYTSRRTHAVRDGRRLLRFGEPVIDRLLRFAELDDRGRTFIVEVPVAGLRADVPPTFLFLHDVSVQPDARSLDAASGSARASLASIAMRFLPVRLERVYSLDGLPLPAEATLRRLLELPSVNLASRPERLGALLSGVQWEAMCDRVHAKAMQAVHARLAESGTIQKALARLDHYVGQDRAVRSSRKLAGLGGGAPDDDFSIVRSAIESPDLSLDGCGVLVLTGAGD
jgi:ATP-dependent helicase HepA